MAGGTAAFDWQDFYILASGLSEFPADSARRSAISRAYYAVFHKAQKVYKHHNPVSIPSLGNESHYIVWKWFTDHTSRNYKKVGTAGERLKKSRVQADYHDSFPGLAEQVIFQMKNAETLIIDLDKLIEAIIW